MRLSAEDCVHTVSGFWSKAPRPHQLWLCPLPGPGNTGQTLCANWTNLQILVTPRSVTVHSVCCYTLGNVPLLDFGVGRSCYWALFIKTNVNKNKEMTVLTAVKIKTLKQKLQKSLNH